MSMTFPSRLSGRVTSTTFHPCQQHFDGVDPPGRLVELRPGWRFREHSAHFRPARRVREVLDQTVATFALDEIPDRLLSVRQSREAIKAVESTRKTVDFC